MNYLVLMTILFVTILLLYKFLDFDLFNPIIISILCFEAGLLFCAIMLPYWKYEISFKSIFVVCILFSFMIFSAFFGKKISKKIVLKNYNSEIININEFTNYKKIIILFIVLLFSASIINNYYNIGYKYGFDGNWFEFTSLSMVIKSSNLTNGSKLLRINTYMQYVLKGITYCSLFLFIYNIFKLKKSIKNNVFLLLYILPYLFIIYISGWRQDFIFVSFYVLMMIGFYNNRSDDKIKELLKSFIIMVGIFFVIFILWCITAFLRSNGKFNFYEVFKYVATYFGGGIINFDQYINGFVLFPESKIFGERVFSNIYTYLNRLHITNISVPYAFLKSDNFIHTNIYSAFFRSYNDFGLIGCGFYFGIIFYILSFVYSLLHRYKNLFFISILYAYFCYPICLIGVDDAFIIYLISTTPLYVLFSYGIVYYFMIYTEKKSVA